MLSAATPSPNRSSARRARGVPYAARPNIASAVASAPSTISQDGTRLPSTICVRPYFDSTSRSSAVSARSSRSARKRANAGSSRLNACWPSPSAQTVRASQ